MTTLFLGMGIQFLRVPAVDGEKLTQQDIEKWVSESGNFYRLGPGEVGCFLSHRRCWEMITERKDNYAAIFEDDLHFDGEGFKDLFTHSDWIPVDADVVKLETTFERTLYQKRVSATMGSRNIQRSFGPQSAAAAYIISRDCAEELLNISEQFSDPVDQFIFNDRLKSFNSRNVYQIIPAVCTQDLFISKNHSSRTMLESSLYHERPIKHKTLGLRLIREIQRPIERASIKLRALASGKRWEKIPFGDIRQ